MADNKKLDALVKGIVVDDRPRRADKSVIPPKGATFSANSLRLPKKPFTQKEIAAVRAATSRNT